MNKKVLILLLVLLVMIAGAAAAYNALADRVELNNLATGETVTAEVPEGTQAAVSENLAPDFTVYDREGNAYSLSDFRGKPVVLNFWTSWCNPCKHEMPYFQEKYEEYGDRIQFLMVNLTDGSQETVDSAQGYIDSQSYTFPVYFDTEYSGAIAYSVSAIPATYFIDETGELVAYGKSSLSSEQLQRGIDMLVSAFCGFPEG